MNESKAKLGSNQWAKWKASGAVGNIYDAVIRTVNAQSEGKTPQEIKPTLLDRLIAMNPNRNFAFTAVETLTDPDEMRTFMREYTHWQATESQDPYVIENSDSIALQNIGYITVYYGQGTVDRWQAVFSDMRHPVFGRNIPFNDPEVASHLGTAEGLVRPQS